MAQVVLPGRLTGRKVLMVTLPSGRDQADRVRTMLTTAGATITGRIDDAGQVLLPDNARNCSTWPSSAAQPTIPVAGLPSNSDGVETASALLASAVLDRTQGTPPAAADRHRAADRVREGQVHRLR